MHAGLWWEGQNEIDYQQDIDVGSKISERILERKDAVVYTGFIWLG
jgi:hypothetical protein